MPHTDQEAVRLVLAGEREAFAALVERYQHRLVAALRRLGPDPHACEDLAQEVFLIAFRELRRFDPSRGSFAGWLFTIAHRRCLHELARHRPRLGPAPEPATPATSEARACAEELAAQLESALRRLPGELRRAFAMRVSGQLAYAEIAALEGVAEGTVRARVSRARERLRASLRAYTGERQG